LSTVSDPGAFDPGASGASAFDPGASDPSGPGSAATARLRRRPALAASYVRALVPKHADRSSGDESDMPCLELPCVATDPRRLRRYIELCGFLSGSGAGSGSGTMPATYPHLTAFPMAMALMTRRAFPVPVLGLVHIANEIEQLRPLPAAAGLDYRVRISSLREHARGTAFDVHAQASLDGEPVWKSVSTYLRRRAIHDQRAESAQRSADGSAVASGEVWSLPASLGRRYAAISGDRNPIHMYPLTARAFGYPRPIAHGMWTAARCLAALAASYDDVGLPGAFLFRIEFHKPVPLPARVRFDPHTSGHDRVFSLRSHDGRRDHLRGVLVPGEQQRRAQQEQTGGADRQPGADQRGQQAP
jgi:acyl dehydratase